MRDERAANQKVPDVVLILDDEKHWLELFTRLNRKKGSKFRFKTFSNQQDAIAFLQDEESQRDVYAAFVDIELKSEIDGFGFIERAIDLGIDVPYVICSQHDIESTKQSALQRRKPLTQIIDFFVSKSDLNFESNDVDRIAEVARNSHFQKLVSSFRLYFESTQQVTERWQKDTASLISEIDRLILFSQVQNDGADGDQCVLVPVQALAEHRAKLALLTGSMQTRHLLTLHWILSGGSEIEIERSDEVSLFLPDYNVIRTAVNELQANSEIAARRGKRPRPLTNSAWDKLVSRVCSRLSGENTALALAGAIDLRVRSARLNEAIQLAEASTRHFGFIREPLREISFSIITSQLLQKASRAEESEAYMWKARGLAGLVGDAATQLEVSRSTTQE